MSYFLCAFRIALEQRFRGLQAKFLWILAVLFSAVLLLLPAGSSSAVVQVGLCMPNGQGEALAQLLQERSSSLVAFIATDEETLDKKILSGSWDCGLVVPEDFDRRIKALDTKGILTLKTAPGSTVYPLVQETAAACMMELMTPYIAGSYLRDIGAGDDALEEHLDALAESAPRVQVTLQTLNGDPMDPLTMQDSGVRQLLLGLSGLLILVYGLSLSMDMGKWLTSNAVVRLRSVRRETELLFPRMAAAMLPVLIWGTMTLPFLSGGWQTAAAVPVFCALAAATALVISRIPPLWQAIPVLLPFLTVGCLIFEPVLIDPGSLFPGLKPWTACLPLGLFLRAAGGSTGALAILLAEAAALFLTSLVLDGSSRKPGIPKA